MSLVTVTVRGLSVTSSFHFTKKQSVAGTAARVAVAPDAYVPPPVTVPHVSLLELTLTVYSLVQEATANNTMSVRLKAKTFAFIVLDFKVNNSDICLLQRYTILQCKKWHVKPFDRLVYQLAMNEFYKELDFSY